MAKFTKGDRVRVLRNDKKRQCVPNNTTIGEIITLNTEGFNGEGIWWDIKERKDNGDYVYEDQIELVEEGCSGWVYGEELELVKDTPKPKFKIGDRVKITSANNKGTAYADSHDGSVEVITKIGGKYVNEELRKQTGDTWYHTTGGEIWDVNVDYVVEEGCNSCEVNSDNVGDMLSFAKEVLDRGYIGQFNGFEYYNNEPSNSSGNKVGKIMSKLGNFVKNSLLSADEKLLRKNGLKDSCGDYTIEAQELVIAKLIKDNEAYLIEVATAMEAEENKNK